MEFLDLFNNLPWFIPQSGLSAHPAETCPENIREKADQNVGLDTAFFLVPDGAQPEVVFLDAERFFRIGQLDVGLPELLRRPRLDVAPQEVAAFAPASPAELLFASRPGELDLPMLFFHRRGKKSGCPMIAFQESPAASLGHPDTPDSTAGTTSLQATQPGFQPSQKTIMNGLFFGLPSCAPAEDENLLRIPKRRPAELDVKTRMNQLPGAPEKFRFKLPQQAFRSPQDIAAILPAQ